MKKDRVFYGYWIVVVAFLCMLINGGIGFYSFSLFTKPLQAEFGWSRGTISAAFTLFMMTMGMVGPLIGRMVDRYEPRRVIVIGASIAGLGFIWLSLMHNLWSFYIGYFVIGIGMAALGSIPSTKVVSNWFIRRRGTALGIAASGIGIGGLILAPTFGSYVIPNFGWKISYLALALLTWVLIIPAALLVIKTRPADIGLYPDGVETTEAVTSVQLAAQASKDWTLQMALKTSAFWLIAVAFVTATFSYMGTLQHEVNYLIDIGFPVAMAATIHGVVGFGSAIGKFGFGWLCDRISARYVATISFALQLAAIIILITLKPTSPLIMLMLYAIFFGLGIGGNVPPQSMLVSGSFGLASYGAIYGMMGLISSPMSSMGPLFAGYVFDTTQTYLWVFVVFLVLYVIAIPSILAARQPKQR